MIMPDRKKMSLDTLKTVRLLLLDVDGVLTDGTILYPGNGEEIKVFCVKDGFGIRMLLRAEIGVGIVTGRASTALKRRCAELGISPVYENVAEKDLVLEKIVKQTGITPPRIAFMGDDLPDIPLMKRVGTPIAVADAHPAVIKAAKIVTTARGGKGAVREICEQIITAQGLWEKAAGNPLGS